MKSMSAKEAKNGFGLLLDTARAEPVTIEKHGRPIAVVLSTEEYEGLSGRSSHYEEEFNPQRRRTTRSKKELEKRNSDDRDVL